MWHRRATRPFLFNSTNNTGGFKVAGVSTLRARIEFHLMGNYLAETGGAAVTPYAVLNDFVFLAQDPNLLTVLGSTYMLGSQYPLILDRDWHGDLLNLPWYAFFSNQSSSQIFMSVIEVMYEKGPG